jgi:hypothetical protein
LKKRRNTEDTEKGESTEKKLTRRRPHPARAGAGRRGAAETG